MSRDPVRKLEKRDFPALLQEIPDPPKTLFVRGTIPDASHRFLCVVGSRKFSAYGADACKKLIGGLAGYPVVVVSGLALGIDAIAHESALTAGLSTIAVPGSGINDTVLYPRSHVRLAHTVVERGGALLSENPPDEEATVWSFPKRNRIMAGLCHATLVIEAHEKSGTLITARLAMEYNRDVLIVPGPITSPNHTGSNGLLREGAQTVFESAHILQALGIQAEERKTPSMENVSSEEQKILAALETPKTTDELSDETGLSVSHISIMVSALEIKRFVTVRLGKIQRCV